MLKLTYLFAIHDYKTMLIHRGVDNHYYSVLKCSKCGKIRVYRKLDPTINKILPKIKQRRVLKLLQDKQQAK